MLLQQECGGSVALQYCIPGGAPVTMSVAPDRPRLEPVVDVVLSENTAPRLCCANARPAVLQQERGGSMALQYCITRGAPGTASVGACPARMDHFAFAPIETQYGSFRMAVDYTPSSTITVLKDSTAHAPMAQVLLVAVHEHCQMERHVLQRCCSTPVQDSADSCRSLLYNGSASVKCSSQLITS